MKSSTSKSTSASSAPLALSSVETLNVQDSNANFDLPVQRQDKAGWRHLFAFTRKAHFSLALAALAATVFTAGFKTVLAVILGKIFDVIADFGNGTLDGPNTLSQISKWCLVLAGLGLGNWLASTAFLSFWIIFGELQASSVRHELFSNLLSKDMSWFDTQTEGLSSLLVRIQT